MKTSDYLCKLMKGNAKRLDSMTVDDGGGGFGDED